jgi:hypothetical protein
LDVPEPPQIVLEQPAPCTDGAGAEAALRRALDPSKAPAAAWRVDVRLSREKGVLRATGEITDASGAPVAHRAMEGRECAGLTKAIGVWASLVLDAEVERAKAAAPPPPPPAPSPSPELFPLPAPAEPEKPSPEAELFLAHPESERQLEVGLTSYAMAGTGTGMLAGGSIFTVSEVGNGWFLRPALAIGRTFVEIVPTTHAFATLAAVRFDACKRLPGNYLDKRGIQLDLCGGADAGFVVIDAQTASQTVATSAPGATIPLLGIGPSIDLRGELGNELSVLVRGVVEWNVFSASADGATVTPDLLIGRAEVGLSWRLR